MAQNYPEDTSIGFHVQSLLKIWRELFRKSLFTDFSKAMASYMLFDNKACQFPMLSLHSEGHSKLLERNIFVDAGGMLMVEEDVDTSVLDTSANTDDALRYVTNRMFHSFNLLTSNRNLYPKGEE